MICTRLIGGVCGVVLIASGTVAAQNATLRLEASEGMIAPGEQITIEVFIDNLPVELRGYQIGLTIEGGTSGAIVTATVDPPYDAALVDVARADWVFQDVVDTEEDYLQAGDIRTAPRSFALIFDSSVGALPTGERYLGTFVLEAAPDAAGDFQISLTPPEQVGERTQTMLMTTGGGGPLFPADLDDPLAIPISADGPAMLRVVAPEAIPAVSQWGLIALCLILLTAGTTVLRRTSHIAS